MLAERQYDQSRAALDIRRVRVERQESGARVLAQQEVERGANSGVSEAGQRFGGRDDVPDPSDVSKRDQKRRFAFGASQRRHKVRLVFVASYGKRMNERIK